MDNSSGRDYEPGELIIEFEPIVHCIRNEFKSKFCDNCRKGSDQLKKCSKCYQMYYCDKECQQNDWKCHKYECKVFQRPKWNTIPHDPYMRINLRWWLCYDQDQKFCAKKHPLINGEEFCFNDIEVDVKSLESNVDKMIEIKMIKLCFEALGLNVDQDKFMRWSAIRVKKIFYEIPYYVKENDIRHSIFNYDTNVAMIMVYQVTPYLHHSCVPNASKSFNGLNMKLRAIKPIAQGEKVTLSFIDLKQDRSGRRREMMSKDMPICQCDRCRLHSDKGLDYEEFKALYMVQMQYTIANKNPYHLPIIDRDYQINWNLILYMKSIFGEYHQIISHCLVSSYVYFAENSRYASKSLLKLWYEKIGAMVAITHGSDHPFYENFKEFAENYIEI